MNAFLKLFDKKIIKPVHVKLALFMRYENKYQLAPLINQIKSTIPQWASQFKIPPARIHTIARDALQTDFKLSGESRIELRNFAFVYTYRTVYQAARLAAGTGRKMFDSEHLGHYLAMRKVGVKALFNYRKSEEKVSPLVE